MYMHIPQSRDEKLAGTVDNLSAGGYLHGFIRSNGDNATIRDDYRASRFGGAAICVDYRNLFDGQWLGAG
jgi:hypothetical protein